MTSQQTSLVLHAKFDSIEHLKQTCLDYAVKNTFEYSTINSSHSRYTIKCKSEGCNWRLHASCIENTSAFSIRTFTDTHTCFGLMHAKHQQVTSTFIANKINEKVKEKPDYRIVDIVKDLHRELGVRVTYSKAYRAKEDALAQINETHEDAYKQLPDYCQNIIHTNPNSVAILETTADNKFKRVFICYGASAVGFSHCRPLLGLDGTHLITRYQGILLAATAVDANGSLFPLAYAVVDAENDDNWLWMLRLIRQVIERHAPHFLAPKVYLLFRFMLI